jgi:hypothetical protein
LMNLKEVIRLKNFQRMKMRLEKEKNSKFEVFVEKIVMWGLKSERELK